MHSDRQNPDLQGDDLLRTTEAVGKETDGFLKRFFGRGSGAAEAAAEQSSKLDQIHSNTLGVSGEAKPRSRKSDIELDPKADPPGPLHSVPLGTGAFLGRDEEIGAPVLSSVQERSKIDISKLVSLLRSGKVQEFNKQRPSAGFSLRGIDLSNSDLKGVDFRGLDLTRSILTGCDLTEAKFQKSILDHADLRRTILNKAKFFAASLRHADLSGVTEARGAQFCECNMRSADLSNNGNFSGADFTNARLVTATLTDSNFTNAQMVSVWLAGAVLTNTNFEKANLHRARMFQANGCDVNFKEANLTEAEAIQTHFTSSNKKGANNLVLKTSFENAWTMGFRHNGAISEETLRGAVSDQLPPEGQFKYDPDCDKGKLLIDGIPGTDKVLYDTALEELDELIGLEDVKKQVKELTAIVHANQARLRMGLPPFKCILHRVYLGEPGTGKTTVARIEAKLYYALGLLSKGQVVETDKSGFIAGYAGQSLGKAHETIDSAIGGTLIADEIYALTETKNDDYAKDAMAVIVKRLWDDRDKFCCIFLGYGDEMEAFLNTNKGMRRRIGAVIHFPSYSSGDLIEICKQKLGKQKFSYTPELLAESALLFATIKARDKKNFGNAGTVENTVEQMAMRLSCRLKIEGKLNDEKSHRNPKLDDIPFYKMSGFERDRLPALSELKWVDRDNKPVKLSEIKLDDKFPNLAPESLTLIESKVDQLSRELKQRKAV